MGTKKDIAQAMKEQLDNFTASPNIKVWEHLETELKAKKREKKILPFWFNFTTIGLILLFIAFLNKDSISTFLNIKNKNVEAIDSISKTSNRQIIQKEQDKLIDPAIDTLLNASSQDGYSVSNDSLIVNTSKSTEFANNKSEIGNTNNKNSNNKRQKFKKKNTNYAQKDDGKISVNNSSKVNKRFDSQENAISQNVVSDTFLSRSNKDKKIDNLKLSNNTEKEEKLKDSIEEVLQDSMKKNFVELEDKEKIGDSLTNDSPGKWSVFPNAVFVYYDGFNNSFKDQTTLNYGIYFTYLPHNELSFRIGVNSLNLAQTSIPLPDRILQQEVRYIEIPLELKYSLIKRKLQTSIIGGTSYLILQEAKSIVLEDTNMNTVDNSSDFVESTLSINFGLQFQTKIYKKIYFNLEPMFKYHFKPYSIRQDFNPFIISVTGGVEYKF